MPYELRQSGHPPEMFEHAEDAEARVRDILRRNADVQAEIIDLATGRPYAPAAGSGDREAMARKVGF